MKMLTCLITLLLAVGFAAPAIQAADKPNILLIMERERNNLELFFRI